MFDSQSKRLFPIIIFQFQAQLLWTASKGMENYFLIDEIKSSDKRTMIEIALDE